MLAKMESEIKALRAILNDGIEPECSATNFKLDQLSKHVDNKFDSVQSTLKWNQTANESKFDHLRLHADIKLDFLGKMFEIK